MPELQTPNLISPVQGLTFLAGLAAERARQAEMRDKNVLALQRMGQQMEMQNQKTQTTLQVADMRHQYDMERAGTAQQRANDFMTLGSWSNDIKEQNLKLRSDKLKAWMDDQSQILKQKRENLLKGELKRYGLAEDAFENPEIKGKDVEPTEQGWYKDSKKPTKRFYNQPVYDTNNKRTGFLPITVDDTTFDWMKGLHDDIKSDPASRKIVDPEPAPTLRDRAQAALTDPDATPAEKAAAQKILGGP